MTDPFDPDQVMPRYYSPAGEPLTLAEWLMLLGDDIDRTVAATRWANGVLVSTVYLGLDHKFWPPGPPLIYESMVFADDQAHDLDCQRYSTLAQAWAGHWELTALVTLTYGEPEAHDFDHPLALLASMGDP